MMLTLSQAQERLAAFPGLAIDWARPAAEACRIALAANGFRLRRAEVEAIHEALSAYAAHLSFEAGKAFEAAAVKRALSATVQNDLNGESRMALADFAAYLERGLHYAEPEVPPNAGRIARRGDDGKEVPRES